MGLRAIIAVVFFSALFAAGAARAETNLEGVSGILTVPTAEVVNEGSVTFTMGRFLSQPEDRPYMLKTRTYDFTVGYLPRFEISARFFDYPGEPDDSGSSNAMDRSVAAKYKLYESDRWSAAIGATDVGGKSQTRRAGYAVLTYRPACNLALTAGAGTERLEGVFGGARWQVHERLALLAEYDTENFNYGLELKPYKGLTLTAGQVADHAAFGGSYTFPLDPRGKGVPCAGLAVARPAEDYAGPCEQATAVRDALACQSFENVLVGVADDTLFIEYENRRFAEQLDALGVAAAVALSKSGPAIKRLVISPKLEDVPQLCMSMGTDELAGFLADPTACRGCFSYATYRQGGYPPGIVFAAEAAKKPGRGEVFARPLLGFEITRRDQPTFMTKWGLGLQEEVYLARALKVQGRQDWYMLNDIENEGEKTKPANRDEYLMYFDTWGHDLRVLARAGYFGNGRYGFSSEAGYYLSGNRFKLGARYAAIRDQRELQTDRDNGVILGELSYYEPALDWRLTGLAGTFMAGDRGVRLESRRSFGPTDITFFAYDTNASDPHGGFYFNLRLPWYRDQRHGAWRLGGAPYMPFQYRTDSKPWGDLPLPGYDLEAARQKLGPEYISQHEDQLRRAAWLYLESVTSN